MSITVQRVFLVSACLLGLRTRYDGASKANDWVLSLTSKHLLIPVCPEQLGGLSTPRPAAQIWGGDGGAVLNGTAKVILETGEDVTEEFLRGAAEVLRLARLYKIEGAFLKARSPSCGLSKLGVCAALLQAHGYQIYEID